MAVHGAETGDDDGAALPDVVPFDLPCHTRLSWELGSRVVRDDETVRLHRWEHASARWTLSVFRATSNTVVVRTRTPVGRERFYGATRSDLEEAVGTLEAAPAWRRAE